MLFNSWSFLALLAITFAVYYAPWKLWLSRITHLQHAG